MFNRKEDLSQVSRTSLKRPTDTKHFNAQN